MADQVGSGAGGGFILHKIFDIWTEKFRIFDFERNSPTSFFWPEFKFLSNNFSILFFWSIFLNQFVMKNQANAERLNLPSAKPDQNSFAWQSAVKARRWFFSSQHFYTCTGKLRVFTLNGVILSRVHLVYIFKTIFRCSSLTSCEFLRVGRQRIIIKVWMIPKIACLKALLRYENKSVKKGRRGG